jgi:protein-S-isoprenylcysteine O-methyltransferase Ste14
MEGLVEYLPLLIYGALFAGLKISEHYVLAHPDRMIRKEWGDWTVYLILIPMWLVLIGPVLEFLILEQRPDVWEMVVGGLLFAAAGYLSIKGYRDLQHGFAKAIELEDISIVVTGLYHVIRHPISLANILFLFACPLFLSAGPSWIPALVGVFGVILRISIEESFMAQHVPDYADYKKRTWALIPYIY